MHPLLPSPSIALSPEPSHLSPVARHLPPSPLVLSLHIPICPISQYLPRISPASRPPLPLAPLITSPELPHDLARPCADHRPPSCSCTACAPDLALGGLPHALAMLPQAVAAGHVSPGSAALLMQALQSQMGEFELAGLAPPFPTAPASASGLPLPNSASGLPLPNSASASAANGYKLLELAAAIPQSIGGGEWGRTTGVAMWPPVSVAASAGLGSSALQGVLPPTYPTQPTAAAEVAPLHHHYEAHGPPSPLLPGFPPPASAQLPPLPSAPEYAPEAPANGHVADPHRIGAPADSAHHPAPPHATPAHSDRAATYPHSVDSPPPADSSATGAGQGGGQRAEGAADGGARSKSNNQMTDALLLLSACADVQVQRPCEDDPQSSHNSKPLHNSEPLATSKPAPSAAANEKNGHVAHPGSPTATANAGVTAEAWRDLMAQGEQMARDMRAQNVGVAGVPIGRPLVTSDLQQHVHGDQRNGCNGSSPPRAIPAVGDSPPACRAGMSNGDGVGLAAKAPPTATLSTSASAASSMDATVTTQAEI